MIKLKLFKFKNNLYTQKILTRRMQRHGGQNLRIVGHISLIVT